MTLFTTPESNLALTYEGNIFSIHNESIFDSRLRTGSVDGPDVLMEGVRRQHEHHNNKENIKYFETVMKEKQTYALSSHFPFIQMVAVMKSFLKRFVSLVDLATWSDNWN